ncbi:zinc finger protein 585B-like [Armigeres subalbatus]|uniref:zinc finger protein 585B-like n=1 Tax=Armigeres subalbatus TaxID=124917 RepID=UPI002ED2BE95
MLKMTTPSVIKTEPGVAQSVHQMCRLCLSEECLDDIFKEEGLQRWIVEFLSIKVSSLDHMSRNICTICRIRLIEFHQFKIRCQEVQTLLQTMNQNDHNGDEIMPRFLSTREPPKEHGCKDCGKSYAVRQHLDNHMKIHAKLNHENEKTTKLDENNLDLLVKLREVKTETSDDVELSNESQEQMNKLNSEAILQHPHELRETRSNTELISVVLPRITQDETGKDQSVGIEDMIDIDEVKIEVRTDNDAEFKLLDIPTQSLVQNQFISGITSLSMQCKTCLKFFRTKEQHNNTHEPNSPECHMCKVAFTNPKVLNRQEIITKRYKLQQDPLTKNISTKEKYGNLENHKEHSTNDIVEYSCSECNEIFNRHSSLLNHMKTHKSKLSEEEAIDLEDEEDSNDIDFNASTTTSDQSSKEKAKTGGDEQWKCAVCAKIFENKKNLNHHQRYHASKKHLCSICEKPFINRFIMKRHEQTHDAMRLRKPAKPTQRGEDVERPFKCDVCNKGFKQKDTIYGHKQKVHGPKIHDCHICDTKFSTREHLLRHIRRHYRGDAEDFQLTGSGLNNGTDEANTSNKPESAETSSQTEPKSFKCMKCDKVFHSQNRLWVHYKRGHRKRYTCSSCDVVLETKKQLTAHMATEHRPENNSNPSSESFSCTLCSKWYPTKKQQVLHMKAHATQRYNCKVCGKIYSVRACLSNHMKTHGENLKSNKRKRSPQASDFNSDEESEDTSTEDTSEDEQSDKSTEQVTPSRKQPRRDTHDQTRSKIRAVYENQRAID